MSVAEPPFDGTRTMSYHGLFAHARPRSVAPDPRASRISAPSLLHEGLMYSPGSRVNRRGTPPAEETFHRCPPPRSSQVVNAIQRPSGDQAGEYSYAENCASVMR